ncbi:hypothetical protein [Breoghania corrubedonensis]|nr:hypothetical protein [Breoghania corrubedonensis]
MSAGINMVAPLSASLTSSVSGSLSKAGDPQEAARKEQARIKAEILSARSEQQCATCEGDKATLDEQIATLETRLRQVLSNARVEPAQAASETDDPASATSEAGRDALSATAAADGPAVLIDLATAERARQGAAADDVAQAEGNVTAVHLARANGPLAAMLASRPAAALAIGSVLDISV